MLLHGLQTQAGVVSDLFVAVSFARELRNLPFAPREPGDAWQAEKPSRPDRSPFRQRSSHAIKKCGRATPADLI